MLMDQICLCHFKALCAGLSRQRLVTQSLFPGAVEGRQRRLESGKVSEQLCFLGRREAQEWVRGSGNSSSQNRQHKLGAHPDGPVLQSQP